MRTPTRFKAQVISKEFVPGMDRDLSAQCGLPVKALRLRTSVTHAQPETGDPYNPEEWVPVIPSEPGTTDFITDLFVGYAAGSIHLSGSSFPFDLSLPTECWVWTPSSQIRVNYKSWDNPRKTSSRPDARVLHQYAFPTHLQLVNQGSTVELTLTATPPELAECTGF
jgi:hypothetical protein